MSSVNSSSRIQSTPQEPVVARDLGDEILDLGEEARPADLARDLQVQESRQPVRCQRSTGSGRTIIECRRDAGHRRRARLKGPGQSFSSLPVEADLRQHWSGAEC